MTQKQVDNNLNSHHQKFLSGNSISGTSFADLYQKVFMFKKKTKIIYFLIAVCTSSGHASENKITQKKEELKKIVNISIDSSITTNLERFDADEKLLQSDHSLTTSLSYLKNINTSLTLSGSKGLNGERKFTLNDAFVNISSNLGTITNSSINVTGLGRIYLPISDNSKENTKLQTRLALSSSFSTPLKGLGYENIQLSYTPSANIFFHQYETSMYGSSNTKYLLSNTLSGNYSINEKLALSLSLSYSRKWTYQSNLSDGYSTAQTLIYNLNNKLTLYGGHTLGGSPLHPNGQDIDIKIFNNRSSLIFSGLNVRY